MTNEAPNCDMQVFRIDWTESEAGWGQRPDGYSFHTSLEAASEYLQAQLNRLPKDIPCEYSFPSIGWREPAIATLVLIPSDGLLARELAENSSIRVFRTFDSDLGKLYDEAKKSRVAGPEVSINYGQTPYSPREVAGMTAARKQIEDMLSAYRMRPQQLG